MDENITAPGGVNIAREECGSPTQPFSSPGGFTISKDANRDTDDIIYKTRNTDGMEGGDDKLAGTNECEMNTEVTSIESTYAIYSVTWEDADGQTKEVYNPKSDFKLDIYTNTSANKAMFKLHSYINLKTSRRQSNKQNFYLLIPPERIKTITTQTSPTAQSTASNTAAVPNFYSLHFSLIQEPDFIGPESHLPTSKGKTKAQLDLLQDLATVTEFTIHLAGSDTVTPKQQKDLELLATIFSPLNTENRPRSDNKRGNLATLYAGKGGKVINTDTGVAHDEASPPTYHSATLGHPPVSKRSIQEFNTRLDNLERSIGEVKDTIEEERKGIVEENWRKHVIR
ncbi:hypothetical protein GGI35DRAFT_471469 [Trichoderma velutinum]